MSLVAELKRRNVFRVATAYLVVGWLLTEVLTTVLPTVGAPEWISRAVILAFALGFIPAVALSWLYELTPEGIKRESDIKREGDETSPWARKLDYITIAVDGSNQELYEQYRVGGDLELVKSNIKQLVDLRNRSGRRAPFVELQFLVFEHNKQDIDSIRALADECGVET